MSVDLHRLEYLVQGLTEELKEEIGRSATPQEMRLAAEVIGWTVQVLDLKGWLVDSTSLRTPLPRSRSTDPDTSKEAAISIDPKKDMFKLLRVFELKRRAGLTSEEASAKAGITDGWRRVSDLKMLGLIEATGETRKSSKTGRSCQVLRITEKGIRLYVELAYPSYTTQGA